MRCAIHLQHQFRDYSYSWTPCDSCCGLHVLAQVLYYTQGKRNQYDSYNVAAKIWMQGIFRENLVKEMMEVEQKPAWISEAVKNAWNSLNLYDEDGYDIEDDDEPIIQHKRDNYIESTDLMNMLAYLNVDANLWLTFDENTSFFVLSAVVRNKVMTDLSDGFDGLPCKEFILLLKSNRNPVNIFLSSEHYFLGLAKWRIEAAINGSVIQKLSSVVAKKKNDS